VVVHAGGAQEEEPTNEALIWSHRWVVVDGDRALPGSQALVADGVQVYGYIMVGEASPLGVVTHEFAHDLGLPDLYDTDDSSEGGVGLWDLMAQGAYNGLPRGSSPAHPSASARASLGWTAPTDVTSALVSMSIPAVESTGRVYRLTIAGTAGREYFLVENRQRIGFDAGLPGTGLLIWHVDETRGSNDNDARRHVDLEEADEASTGDRPADPEDAWRSSAAGFGPETTPSSRSYGGADTGWRVRDVSASGDPMTATIARDVTRDVAITEVRLPLHVAETQDVATTVVVRNDGAVPENVEVTVQVYRDRVEPAARIARANTTMRGLPAQTSAMFNTTFRTSAIGRYLVLASAPLAGDEIPTNNERIAHALANVFFFQDDIESGNGSWTRDGTPDDPHRWRVVEDADEDGASHSPTRSWRFGHVPTLLPNPFPPEWHTLTSADMPVPAGAVHLLFYHRYDLWGRTVDTVPINVTETDRARVEVSLDGGPWSLGAEFTGRDLAWHAVSLALRSNGSAAGTVRVRFNASAGVLPDRGGWWVDDVMLAARGLGRAVVLLAPAEPLPGSPRATVRADLKVANVGEFEDLFLLSGTPPGPGWTVDVVTDGSQVPLSTYSVLLAPDHDAAARVAI
ncbi:MAG: M6 family metalloprotease domain-containing protein, partial [Methanobacteriota archaeon]